MSRVKLRASLPFSSLQQGGKSGDKKSASPGGEEEGTASVSSRNWKCTFAPQILTLLLTSNFLPTFSTIMAIKHHHVYAQKLVFWKWHSILQ